MLLAVLSLSCGRPGTGPAVAPVGSWRATLASPGGELPFELRIAAIAGGGLQAVAINGAEEVPFTAVTIDDDRLTLRFDHYDSVITARLSKSGDALEGRWNRQSLRGRDEMSFRARRQAREGDLLRFGPPAAPLGAATLISIAGDWDVLFTDEDGISIARGEFHQEGTHAWGTFLTPTGDYRYLDGDYRDGVLRLSCFDGAHAFLFRARALDDSTLSGDFWSRGSYHATWTARLAGPRPGETASNLPDPFAMTTLENPSGRLSFTFPDLDGRPVSLSDERFAGKPVLVDIFGSWCPNCNDQAPLLAELYRRYHDRGLEIIGLAYEMRGEAERDALFVRRYAERHALGFPLLLAGTSDKVEASATLPDLSGVLAFPTLIFIGRDGLVKAIHTGFEGPGTGRHYDALKARFEELIESLL